MLSCTHPHTLCVRVSQTDSAPVCPCHTQTHRHTLWLPETPSKSDCRRDTVTRQRCVGVTLTRRQSLEHCDGRGSGGGGGAIELLRHQRAARSARDREGPTSDPAGATRDPKGSTSAKIGPRVEKSTKIDRNRQKSTRKLSWTPFDHSWTPFDLSWHISDCSWHLAGASRSLSDTQTHRHADAQTLRVVV